MLHGPSDWHDSCTRQPHKLSSFMSTDTMLALTQVLYSTTAQTFFVRAYIDTMLALTQVLYSTTAQNFFVCAYRHYARSDTSPMFHNCTSFLRACLLTLCSLSQVLYSRTAQAFFVLAYWHYARSHKSCIPELHKLSSCLHFDTMLALTQVLCSTAAHVFFVQLYAYRHSARSDTSPVFQNCTSFLRVCILTLCSLWHKPYVPQLLKFSSCNYMPIYIDTPLALTQVLYSRNAQAWIIHALWSLWRNSCTRQLHKSVQVYA